MACIHNHILNGNSIDSNDLNITCVSGSGCHPDCTIDVSDLDGVVT